MRSTLRLLLVAFFDGPHDRFLDGLQILEHLIVPEPQQPKALLPEPLIPLFIRRCGARVLPTIDLDDEPRLQTDKVDNERTDGVLPPEPRACYLADAQLTP